MSNIVGDRVSTDTDLQNRTRMTGRIPSAQTKAVPHERRIHSSQGLRFGRPETAQIVTKKLIGSLTDTGGGDIQEEIKKYQDKATTKPASGKQRTSYQVRPKYSGRPQHITGY